MAFEYFLYRTDFNNTLVDRSASSFEPLPPNTGEIFIDFFIPEKQPLYLYKEDNGSIVLNDETTISSFLSSQVPPSLDSYVTFQDLENFTGATNGVSFDIFTGYTASTETKFEELYDDIGFLSGETNNRLLTSNFNTYSASTLTNINSRLLTSTFNTYSGATLTNINSRLLTSTFNTYSGATLTNINSRLLTSTFNTFTGTSISTANNGLTKNGTNVRLGGTLTGATTITSPATDSRLSFSGFPIQYTTNLSASYNPRSIVDNGYVTGLTSTLNNRLSNVETNYVSGATNLGTGSTIFTTKVNRKIELKSISGKNGIGVSGNTNQIVIYRQNEEVFVKEKTTIQTTTSPTLVNYDTTTVNLSGGNYKITYSIIWGSSVTNQNSTIEFRVAGTNIFPTQYIGRLANNGERRYVTQVKYINLPFGNETFSIAFSIVGGGTMTMYYSLILIEKVN